MTKNDDRSLERRRARFAYERVASWRDEIARDATTRAQGLPIEVRSLGLSTAVAVLLRENRLESHALAQLLCDWLLTESPQRTLSAEQGTPQPPGKRSSPSTRDLLRASIDAERSAYLAAQADSLALLDHVKLLARAYHGKAR